MPLDFLAIVCRAFNLSIKEFYELRGLMGGEIRRYLAAKKQLSAGEVLAALKELKEIYEGMAPLGILYPGHVGFPGEFYEVVDPPVFLSYAGDLEILRGRKISVVGTRNPHFRFLEWMELHLAEFLRDSASVLVSGGAVGIDQKASKLAMAGGGKGVVILPSGLANIYPKNISSWRNDRRLLFLSEYLPNQAMRRHHFVVRNRLISALGSFLLVIQAAQKSGSMITVGYAMDQGKEIATLPDFPGFVESAGNLRMLRDGAQLVYGVEDLKTIFARLHC